MVNMEIIVQKYGGTSMGDSERIKHVASKIVKAKKEGYRVVAVVSAQAGVTDALVQKAKEISKTPCPKELDLMLSTGEQISVALLSMAIKELGEEAVSMNCTKLGILTDARFNDARIQDIKTDNIMDSFKTADIIIATGFQGLTIDNQITTLGRGGSDTSAVAIAAALGASCVDIYTDVDGVFTADPKCVCDAKKIDRMSYQEMIEMSASGAKVLHLRSVVLAAKYHLAIHLRSSFKDMEGTIITEEENMENVVVRGVAHSVHHGIISLSEFPGPSKNVAHLFKAIADAGVNVDVITQSEYKNKVCDVSFTVSGDVYPKAFSIAKGVAESYGVKKIKGTDDVARVSIIGIGMKSNPGVAAKVFETLSDEGIEIDMITTSDINISCIVAQKDYAKAVQAIHLAFQL